MTVQTIKTKCQSLFQSFASNKPLHFVIFGIILLILLAAPYYDIIPGSRNSNGFIIPAIYYTVAALGLNLLLGFGGLISLASAAFIGIGAMGMGYLMIFQELSFFLSLIITIAVTLALGLLVGLFSLKVSGIYLTIGTLFFAAIIENLFLDIMPMSASERLSEITFFGNATIDTSNSYTQLRTGEPQYDRYIALVIMVVVLVLSMIAMYNIVKSKTGRAFLAMSRSANAAAAMGINIGVYRIIAFMIASLYATIAGILYVIYGTSIQNNIWTLELSLFILAVVIVGGMRSIFGTFIGALLIFTVPNLFINEYLRTFSSFLDERFDFTWSAAGFAPVFAGLLIIVVTLFYPAGLIKLFYDAKLLIIKLFWLIRRQIKRLKGGEHRG